MSTQIEYYVYPEDDLPESQPQIDLSKYLMAVLEHLYRLEKYFVTGNLAIYPPSEHYPFRYITPDVALFRLVLPEAERRELTSWQMRDPNRPAPTVVIEISSKETWPNDLSPKPEHYRVLEVKEYFAYDPQGYWPDNPHLRGWRYVNGQIESLSPNDDGWLWSEELNSWLAPDYSYLRLYDRAGQMRLTSAEANDQAREEAERKVEAEQRAREEATQRAEAEQRARELERRAREEAERQAAAEKQRAEAERQAKEAAIQQAQDNQAALEALLKKLRDANIDIDKLP